MDKAFLVKLLETVKLQEKEKEERSRSRSSSGGDAALEEELEGIKEIREEYDPAIHGM